MRNTLALGCFFLSGFAGLVYEVCWIRMSSLIFGSTIFAVSTVLAVFFFGLALGSYLFGQVAQRTERPLRLFAVLELGIGVLAVLAVFAFSGVESIYGVAYRAWDDSPALLTAVRIGLVALVLLPPTILMGGTLPLFCRQFVLSESRIAGSVGLLYGLNTLGAAAGCAAAGFVLLPGLGVQKSIAVGVMLNLLVAAVVGSLGVRALPAPPEETATARVAVPGGRAMVLLLVFFAGFVALGNEVMWTRYLGLLVDNNVYTYTLTLTTVLVGIVLGSIMIGRRVDRWTSPGFAFGLLQVASGLMVLALMLLPPGFWRILGRGFARLTGFESPLICAVLLLPPAVLAGASFPLAARMVVSDPALAGVGVGRLTAVNTLGGILGSLAVGFLILPQAGLHATMLFATGLSLAIGFAAWVFLARGEPVRRRVLSVASAAAVWLALPFALGTHLPADFLGSRSALVGFREGLSSNVSVLQRGEHRILMIDRYGQGTTEKTHLPMVAHHLLLMHPRPKRVLVVGVGAGQMARRLLMYDVEQVDCVDIEPAVFDIIRDHYVSDWMDDPRVRLIRADGRNYLTHSDATYDAIAMEIGQVFRPGCAFFYTAECYRKVRERLAPGGFACQFFTLVSFTPDQFRSAVATFLDAFPQSSLWYNAAEPILIGMKADRLGFDTSGLERLAADGPIRDDLAYAHWGGPRYHLNRPEVFLASFLSGPSGLEALAGGAPLFHDDRPVLDTETLAHSYTGESMFDLVPLLQQHTQPVEHWLDLSQLNGRIDPAVVAGIRAKNLADLGADALVKKARRRLSWRPLPENEELVREALRRNPESIRAHLLLGDVLEKKGDHAGAERARAEAARLERDEG